jgi:hypothetical protein
VPERKTPTTKTGLAGLAFKSAGLKSDRANCPIHERFFKQFSFRLKKFAKNVGGGNVGIQD